MPRLPERELDDEEEQQLGASLRLPGDFGLDSHHVVNENRETWVLGPVVVSRDSDLLAISNWETLRKALEADERLAEDWCVTHCGHWACGWVDHLSFRAFDRPRFGTQPQRPARMARVLAAWNDALADYPVADSEDWSRRETAATLENIHTIGNRWTKDGTPEGWPSEVYGLLDDRELEPRDGGGGWPSDASVRKVLKDLGYLEEDE